MPSTNSVVSAAERGGPKWGAVILAFILAGCAPLKSPPPINELQRQALPNARIPTAWTVQGAGSAQVQDSWLVSLGDAQLQRLIEEALAYNADLPMAAARVEQAAASVKAAGGQLYPAVDLFGRAGVKDASSLRGVFLNASWELDVWGRVRYGVRAAEDQYASIQADYEYARQSLAALVAKAWLVASEARLQRELASETLGSARRLLGLSEDRLRVGVAPELDVALARANLQTLRDSARQLDLAYEQSLRALELLLGRYPAAEIEVPARLAAMPDPVPVGLPSELLERRPDVIAAERRVAAAFNRVEEAKAAMLPKISLTTGINYISSDVFVLKDRDNPAWSVGANLVAPLFHGGALQAQVEIRTAEQKQAVAAYAQTGLKAFSEVESALASEFALREREAILEQSEKEHQRVVELEEIRYRVGARDLRSVSEQQLALYTARMTLLRAQSEQRIQRVNLYLGLGGSFGETAQLSSANRGTSR